MADGLTERQHQILTYIVSYSKEFGYPPSFQDIATNFKFASLTAVRDHLKALEKKGFLKKSEYKARALEVVSSLYTDQPESFESGIPLIGKIAAGSPILAQENIETYISFGTYFRTDGNNYALKIQGDSMKDEGILNGDIVIIKYQETANNGDIIVAIINDEATLKTYYREDKRIRLQPQNPDYAPIFVDSASGDFRIGGKLIGVVRKYGAKFNS